MVTEFAVLTGRETLFISVCREKNYFATCVVVFQQPKELKRSVAECQGRPVNK